MDIQVIDEEKQDKTNQHELMEDQTYKIPRTTLEMLEQTLQIA